MFPTILTVLNTDDSQKQKIYSLIWITIPDK